MTKAMSGPWRKSSFSGDEGNCVELAWHKSSHSENGGNCVELGWHKSSHSENESNCVELASVGTVRDSKNPGGATLRVDLPTLITAVRSGRFDS